MFPSQRVGDIPVLTPILGSCPHSIMDLPCDILQQCDDIMTSLYNADDSGLCMDYDFRNDGTLSPIKPTPSSGKRKRSRFSPKTGTYSRQSTVLTSQISAANVFCGDNIVGDGSKICGLPTVSDSRHDLKCITSETLADVISGKYNIGSYAIIDCRYPYEYNGGHIISADNIYQTDGIEKLLTSKFTSPTVLIFHCEFSIERGPTMCRYLRQKDREANADNYPELHYPEVYLLQGGYKSFYHAFPEHCTPEGYTPMLHKSYSSDLRHFRSKSKSWSAGQPSKPKKRSLLF